MVSADSTPLQVRCGTAGPYALELRVAGAAPRLLPEEGNVRTGAVPAGWRRAAVLTADDELGTLQMYLLTPAGAGNGAVGDLTFHGFYVRGAFTAEAIGGKPRDVNLAWAAWREA